ncbi:uncharacterized protein B0I36DRAFT_28768 [Microdochium trichocladiopsis]|uniref:GPI anchored serine-threonine rich protein n=1 Tax=Microdochium trichocladiopsis TaxID=1682393 RepID=A0A9P8XW83_9PEZI|nr:uncharacterized protein B0I36DRAFT_28768 [Microdochium trichocladiopsis]KAH7021082.1 hypothetical protein B0I36DRAFT_28768 [Microdochium trichocladiopsis]
MRSTLHTLAVLLTPAVVVLAGTTPTVPRRPSNGLAAAAAKCDASEEVCEDSCMYIGATCCNDGTSTFCDIGYYCTLTSCCLNGATCDEPPLDPDATVGSSLPGFTWTWDLFPTSTPDDVATTTDDVNTYSFSFDAQPTPAPGETNSEDNAGVSSSEGNPTAGTSDAATNGSPATDPITTSAPPPPPTPPLGPAGAAGHRAIDSGVLAGIVVAAAGFLV